MAQKPKEEKKALPVYIMQALFFLNMGVYAINIYTHPIRADEFFSYIHSNPNTHSYLQIIRDIYAGNDFSYLHAVILKIAFSLFGYNIFTQRCISFLFTVLGFTILLRLLRLFFTQQLYIWATLLFLLSSSTAYLLAFDGRFYSLLFCISVFAFYCYTKQIFISQLPSIWMGVLIITISLLTTPLSILLFIIIWILMIVTTRQLHDISLWSIVLHISIQTIVTTLYYLVFTQSFFYQYLQYKLSFSTPQVYNYESITQLMAIPFRWIGLVQLSESNNILDVAITLLALLFCAGIGKFARAKLFHSLKARWLLISAFILYAGYFMLLVAHVSFHFTTIHYRYFSFAWFIPGTALLWYLFAIRANAKKNILIWLIAVIGVSNAIHIGYISYKNNQLIAQQAEWAKKQEHLQKNILCIEQPDGDYKELAWFANTYLRFGHLLQTNMIYCYTPHDFYREKYFNMLHTPEQYTFVKTAVSVQDSNFCSKYYVVARQNSSTCTPDYVLP